MLVRAQTRWRPNYQRKCDISDVEDSGEEDKCELGTRLMDPGHGSEIHDSEMTVGSTRGVDGGGGLLVLPQRCPVSCDSGAVRQRAPTVASHVVGVTGVDNGEDAEGPQQRRVRQNGAQRGARQTEMAQISDVGSHVYGIENKVEKQLRSSALSINQNGVSQSRDDGLTVCKQSHFVNQGVPVKHKKVTYNVDKDNCFNRRPVLSSRVHPESDREPSDRNRHNCYSNESSSEEDANSDRRRTSRRHKHQSGDESTGRRTGEQVIMELRPPMVWLRNHIIATSQART